MALAALRKSLKLQPNNLEAILSIAASFTNESYQAHACHSLQGKIYFNVLISNVSIGLKLVSNAICSFDSEKFILQTGLK